MQKTWAAPGPHDDGGLSIYRKLRETNPHLPDPDKVRPEWSLEYGGHHALATVTITVYIDMSEGFGVSLDADA